jgi:hypothetical protein
VQAEIMKECAKEKVPGDIRQKVLVFGAVAAIVASGWWIYHWESEPAEVNVALHESIGNVLAEETFREVGRSGKIVIVTMETKGAPELKVQMAAFNKHLKLLGGCTIADKVVLDPGENPKFRPGSGLSAKRFLKIARKHKGVDAIVSFVGAPEVTPEDLKQLRSVPKFIAETRSPEKLVGLLQEKVLISAVVPRFEFPAPGPREPKTTRQWFDHYFQLVRADTALPKEDSLP